MKCQADIEILADNKLKEADCLFVNGFYDGAFYLGGYAIELLLKAKVCKTLAITDFFLFDKAKNKDAYRPYKVHDYDQLLIFSGLFTDFEVEKAANQVFQKHWFIVRTWSEEARYLTVKTQKDAENFLISVNEFCLWIRKYL